MANLLAVGSTPGATATFSVAAGSTGTLHLIGPADGALASECQVRVDYVASNGSASDRFTLGSGAQSQTFDPGSYKVTRLAGNCGVDNF